MNLVIGMIHVPTAWIFSVIVCVRVHMCACMRVCFYISVCAHARVCMHICMCVHVHACICMCECIPAYVCVSACAHVCGGSVVEETGKE